LDEGIIIHLLSKEGMVRELSFISDPKNKKRIKSKKSSFLADLVSSAEAMALVHDLELDIIEYEPILYYLHQEYPLERENKLVSVPTSMEIIFERQTARDALLNASALVWGFDQDTPTTKVLKQIVNNYKGLQFRRKSLKSFDKYRDLIELKLGRLAFFLMENPDFIPAMTQKAQKTNKTQEKICKYCCIGIYKFNGVIRENYYCSNGHLMDKRTKECPICNEPMLSQPIYNVENITFASLTSQLKVSDALRYVILWPKIGQRIVRTFIRQNIWNSNRSSILLVPRKIVCRANEGNIVSLWNFSENQLTVAVFSDNPLVDSKELLFTLEEHKSILKQREWFFNDLVSFYGMSTNFENESIVNHQGKLDTSILLDLDFKQE